MPNSPVFGALGGGLILMTWFYLLCVALLAGAELNAILLARRRHRAELRAAREAEQETLPGMDAPTLVALPDVDQPAEPAPALRRRSSPA